MPTSCYFVITPNDMLYDYTLWCIEEFLCPYGSMPALGTCRTVHLEDWTLLLRDSVSEVLVTLFGHDDDPSGRDFPNSVHGTWEAK